MILDIEPSMCASLRAHMLYMSDLLGSGATRAHPLINKLLPEVIGGPIEVFDTRTLIDAPLLAGLREAIMGIREGIDAGQGRWTLSDKDLNVAGGALQALVHYCEWRKAYRPGEQKALMRVVEAATGAAQTIYGDWTMPDIDVENPTRTK